MSWRKVKLGELLINRENRFKPNDKSISGLKRIDKIDFLGNIYISDKSSNTDMILVKKGDLVISGINVEKGAMSVYVGEEDVTATIHYSSYSFDEKKIDLDFLKMFLKSLEFKKALKEQVPGGIKTEIKPKHILPLEVIIPETPFEQREVVKSFSIIRNQISQLETNLSHQQNHIKLLRQSFLREAMQGKLVPQNPDDGNAKDLLEKIKAEKAKLGKKEKPLPPIKPGEIPFEIPENWVWCRLGEIAYITSGSTPSQDSFIEKGIPYLKMYNLKNQKIDFFYRPQYIKEEVHNGQLKRCRAFPGDILMNIVGPPLGKIALIPEELTECNFNQAAVLIRPLIKEMNLFIFWYLNEMSEINSIDTKGVAGQNNISVTQAHNMRIPIPPFNEQQRIVAKLKQLMEYCDQLKNNINLSIQQNEMLMQQVLREALKPKMLYAIDETFSLAAEPEETKVIYNSNVFKPRKLNSAERTILAGHIINLNNSVDFGRVKFQKLLYLTEHFCKLDFGSNYMQNVAGPYDSNLINEIESTLKRYHFFDIRKQNTEYHKVSYRPLSSATELNASFTQHFETEAKQINNFLSKFIKLKWETCEIIATLFAVWNNRIIKQEPITDELLKYDFFEWDVKKIKYKNQLDSSLNWMKKEGVIPDGWGKVILKAK